ncbi:MAG TPA: hypothetical protein VLE89_08230 [Chlamydiales bacterium]|nr:hypothetical protein [Chlamydiales bacterium]
MPNFSQATPSVGALTLGIALEIEQLDSQLQQDGFKVLQTGVQTEGATAKGLGDNIQAAMEQDAKNMEYNAYANLSQSGMQITGEVLGEGGAAVKFNKTLTAADNELKQTDQWDELRRNVEKNPAKVVLVNGDEAVLDKLPQFTDAQKESLRTKDFGKDSVTDEDRKALLAAQKGDPKFFAQIKAEITRVQRTKQRIVTNLEGKKQQYQQRWTNRSQMAGLQTQAGLQYQAALEKRLQAGYEAARQQSQYAFDTISRANNTTGETVKNWASNQKDAVQTLQAGIAQANKV